MQAPSLAFALAKQQQIQVAGCPGYDGTPHARVATPSRATVSPSGMTPTHGATPPFAMSPSITPIASPAHQAMMQQSAGKCQAPAAVSVIAPGGGTGINSQVYAELGQDPRFLVDIVGRSRAPYDQYPEHWPQGVPAPNLVSFAHDVLRQGWVEKSDCFVFGSRGGQVVLPTLWQHRGDAMPPVVCINGGCAMSLPQRIHWPDAAVSFLLLGGQDYFRGHATTEQYLAETKAWVAKGNSTTAILFVNEMEHMPQAALLRSVLPLMLRAILNWKQTRTPPRQDFRSILAAVNTAGWSGRFMYTQGPGDWATDVDFGPFHVAKHTATALDVAANSPKPSEEPIQMSKKAELKELLRAAVRAAQPSGGAPLTHTGDRFAAAAHAAALRAAETRAAPGPRHDPMDSPKKKATLSLPIAAAGSSSAPSPGLTLPIPAAGSHSPGLTLPIPAAGSPSLGLTLPIPAAGSPGHGVGAPSPGGGRTPKTPNRLQVPPTGPSPSRSPVAPTPISRALGMPHFHVQSPGHSPFHAHAASAAASSDQSPYSASHPPTIRVQG